MHKHTILQNKETLDFATRLLFSANKQIVLVSAFLKLDALKWLAQFVPQGISVKIVSRWRKGDILSGSSDLEAYHFIQSFGWQLYIDQSLHAKALLIDSQDLIMGSSNYTANGLHIFDTGNNELNVHFTPSIEDVNKIYKYVDDALLLTKPLWEAMKKELESDSENTQSKQIEWSQDILNCFIPVIDSLWVSECFKLYAPDFKTFSDQTEDYAHDLNLLGTQNPTIADVRKTKIFQWLDNLVTKQTRNLNFGFLSECLHDTLIDDPKPYRKEVKHYVATLFSWVEEFKVYPIVQYNRTKAIETVKNDQTF
jgi:hypothetical protein